jgi:hypothetical protein
MLKVFVCPMAEIVEMEAPRLFRIIGILVDAGRAGTVIWEWRGGPCLVKSSREVTYA